VAVLSRENLKSSMEPKQDIELTIRTATLIKSLSHLVGASDARLAKMMFAECVVQFGELGKFIESVQSAQRR
jgi:hypothetical protein